MIEKLLKKAIEQYEQELSDINSTILGLQWSIKPIAEDLQTAKEELRKICKHVSVHRVDGQYMSGGYDHVSEQPYTIVCDNCGKVLESKCIRGTYA